MEHPGGSKPVQGAREVLAGGLYLVAVPIGNAADITLRALDVLTRADVVACEDTRAFRRLAAIHRIPLRGRRPVSWHDRSTPGTLERLRGALLAGQAVAYAPEAGTALVSDPGYRLVRAALAEGVSVIPVPGASAHLAALTVAGLPPDRYLFAGFPPARQGRRRRFLAELAAVPATLVFHEVPHRLAASLADMAAVFGDRPAVVARELTKRFEEVRRESLAVLAAEAGASRGEHVILVGPPSASAAGAGTAEVAVAVDLEALHTRDAARHVAKTSGIGRRAAYRAVLAQRRRD